MKRKLNKQKIKYEKEADVLMIETSSAPIDHAQEIGNVVVHFSKKNKPVLLEFLEASKFIKQAVSIAKLAK